MAGYPRNMGELPLASFLSKLPRLCGKAEAPATGKEIMYLIVSQGKFEDE